MNKRLSLICVIPLMLVSACESAPKSFTLNKHYLLMDIGETYQLSINENINLNSVSFSSSNDNVAMVSSQGLVRAISGGDASIKATYKNLVDSCEIKVNAEDLNLEVYKVDSNFNLSYQTSEYGIYSLKTPLTLNYNTKNNSIDTTNNFKVDMVSHLFDGEDLDVKENIKTLALITSPQESVKYFFDEEVDLSVFGLEEDEKLLAYGNELLQTYKDIEDLSGDDLHQELVTLGDEIFYSYLSKEYQAGALLNNDNLKYYRYHTGESEIMNALIALIGSLKTIINFDLDLDNLDLDDFDTDTDSETNPDRDFFNDLIKNGVDFDTHISLLSGETTYTISLNETGIEMLNDYLKDKADETSEISESDLKDLTQLSVSLTIKRVLLDRYVSKIEATFGNTDGTMNINLSLGKPVVIENQDAFIYESRHQEFEETN